MKIKHYRRFARGSVIWVLAISIAYIAQSTFIRAGDLLDGVVLFVIAGALVVNSLWTTNDLPEVPITRCQTLAAMTVILLLAAGMRFWDLASIPQGVWFDEAENGLVATRIVTDLAYKPIYISGLTQLPALFFYYMGAWIGLIGSNILAVRLASASIGLLTIPGLYLLGKELFGSRVGLAGAFLLGLSRWDVNFSRFGMNGIVAPFFLVYSLYFLARGFRTRSARDFELAGLFIGLGLYSYLAFNIVPVLVVLWVSHKLVVGRMGFVRAYWRQLALGAIVAFVVFLPLGVFAVKDQSAFLQRADTASLFTGKSPGQARAALISNVLKHVEMFNFHGDNNGRHNLAGAPELDDGTAALFVLGIIIAGARARQPRYLLLLLWLGLLLLPAILSLDFEAPQSYRAIGVIPVTSLLAAIPIVGAWSTLRGWLASIAARAPSALAVIGLIAIGYANFHVYWFQQVWDGASWPAFSTQETLIAREINRLGSSYRVLLDPIFMNTPTLEFLSPDQERTSVFKPAVDLPLRDSANTVVFASDLNVSWMDAVGRQYPNAVVKTYQASASSNPILYEAVVSSEQAGAIQGVVGSYSAGPLGKSHPVFTREDKSIDFNWAKTTPIELPYSVDWKTTLSAPIFGQYVFKLDAPADSQLTVDEFPLIKGGEQRTIQLARGAHSLELKSAFDAPHDVRLYWQPPGGTLAVIPTSSMFVPPASNRGLLARYFQNDTGSGEPALEIIDPVVSQYFHLLPVPRPFTVEWTGKIDIPSDGLYRFGTQSIDYSWLYIDDKLLVDNSHQVDHYAEGAVNLTGGLHDIRVRYQNRSGHTFINLYWQPPGLARSPLPSERLFPPQGAYPDRAGPLRPPRTFKATVPLPPAAPPPTVAEPAAAIGTLPVSPLALIKTIGATGSAPGSLADPRGVAVDQDGNVYVVDSGNKRVEEFSADGSYLRSIGGPGKGDGKFGEPVDAVVNPKGEIVVLDSTEGWIQRFSSTGAFLGKFGGPSAGFYHPRAIAVDLAGNYFVADTGTGNVVVFNPDGGLVKKVKLEEQNPGKPIQPVGVTVDSQGSIYVTDAANYYLTRYDTNFQIIKSWLLPRFSSVEGAHVVVALDGSVYVSDSPGHRVIHIDGSGKLVDQLGVSGQMKTPVGLARDANGHIFVADGGVSHVLEYGP